MYCNANKPIEDMPKVLTNIRLSGDLLWWLAGFIISLTLALFLSLQAGVFAVFFMAVAYWTWHYPEDGFLLFLILAPLLPMLKITQTIGTVTLVKDVIILTLFFRQVMRPLLTRALPYRRNPLWWPLVTLAIVVLVGMFRADSLILGILRARDIALYVLLFMAVLYLPTNKQILWRRLKWFTLSLVIVLALGIWQWFTAFDSMVQRFDPVNEVWIARLSSVLAHPSIFGEYLVGAVTLFGALTLFGRGNKRIGSGLLGIALLPFIFLTYTRAAWLGLVFGGGAMGLTWLMGQAKKRLDLKRLVRWAPAVVLMGVLSIVMLFYFTPVGTFGRTIFDPTYGSNEERVEFLVRLVAPMSNVEAMVGRGLGDVLEQNFRVVTTSSFDLAAGDARSVQLTKNRTLVDNQYLKTWVELGLVGLLIYGWIFLTLGWCSWQVASRSGRSEKTLGIWGMGFLAAFVLQGLFIDIWEIFPTNAYFWIVAALVIRQFGSRKVKQR